MAYSTISYKGYGEDILKDNVDMNFMISNGVYRQEFNKQLNIDYLYGFIEKNNREN